MSDLDNPQFQTPIHQAEHLSKLFKIDLRFKRDDLLPQFGGGNKARMMVYKIREIERQNCDAIVTAGPTQSNHARVTALLSASKGWQCKLILHGSKSELLKPRGNLLLMLLAGAGIEIVDKDKIRASVKKSLEDFRREGYKPYEIHGGENITGSLAYFETVKELSQQCEIDGWFPDWIVSASATGITQAGLIVGVNYLKWESNVVGISVARSNPRGMSIVKDKCEELARSLNIDVRNNPLKVDFRDDWIGEGYGLTNKQTKNAIIYLASSEGIILDPTYTGKAFAGLLDLINQKEIKQGDRVLFWHTGGMFNLFASDYSWENI